MAKDLPTEVSAPGSERNSLLDSIRNFKKDSLGSKKGGDGGGGGGKSATAKAGGKKAGGGKKGGKKRERAESGKKPKAGGGDMFSELVTALVRRRAVPQIPVLPFPFLAISSQSFHRPSPNQRRPKGRRRKAMRKSLRPT